MVQCHRGPRPLPTMVRSLRSPLRIPGICTHTLIALQGYSLGFGGYRNIWS